MGTVKRAGRLALVSILAGAGMAACGSPAPTASSFSTKQIVPLAGWGWAAGAQALNADIAASVSEMMPVTTNIVGTAPWLGFPGPAAYAAGLASPWPTFAGNVGTAAVMNGQMGYILGLGPLGVATGAPLYGMNTFGLAAPAGILGYAGLPFISAIGGGAPIGGAPIAGTPIGGAPVVGGTPAQPPAETQPAPSEQQPSEQQPQQPSEQSQQPAAQQPAASQSAQSAS